jgi:hypothetical protein
MESRSFPSNFDIAGRYAKHREQDYLRYDEGLPLRSPDRYSFDINKIRR